MVKLIYKKLHIKRVRKKFITHKSKNINIDITALHT